MRRWVLLSSVILAGALALAGCGYADTDPQAGAVSDQTYQPRDVIQPASAGSFQAYPERAVPAEMLAQAGGSGINVQGFGQAVAPVDLATLQLLYGPNYSCEGCVPPDDGTPPEMPGVTLDDLQPMIDALVALGVSPDDIEASIIPGAQYGYYEKYGYEMAARAEYAPTPGTYPGGGEMGQILVRVSGPTSERLLQIVTAANDAAYAGGAVQPYNIGALYSVDECSALEQQAIGDAVDDARARAELVGAAIGAAPGGVSWISMYPGYDPYGGSPCGQSTYGYPVNWYPPYDPNMPLEVRVMATVNVTFALE